MPSPADLEKYNQLAYYTLAKQDPFFIHQYVVDAFAAEFADESTKPITIVFALVGLYLASEKNFTGREVQLEHMRLAKVKREWPKIVFPNDRGAIIIDDVLAATDDERDTAIKRWVKSSWDAWKENRGAIQRLVGD